MEGGCNAVASTFGVLGAVSRKYAHKIPFLVKINHNELLTYPNQHERDSVRHGRRMLTTWARRRSGRPSILDRRDASREIIEMSRGLRLGARAGHGNRALVLPAQQRLQEGQGLPRFRRSHRSGQSPRRARFRRTSSSRSSPRITVATRRSTRAAPATASSTSASTPS